MKRSRFDPESEGTAQSILLTIACRYVPGWSQERAGRKVAVPYRVARATEMDGPSTYKWFTGSRPVARRPLMVILEAVLRRAQQRERYITEMEVKGKELEARIQELMNGHNS